MELQVVKSPSKQEVQAHFFELSKCTGQAKTPLARDAYKNFSLQIQKGQELCAGALVFVQSGHLFIEAIWTRSAFRHQGLAKRLIQEIEQIAQEHGCLRLITSTFGFHKALPFWIKNHFEISAEFKGRNEEETLYYLRKDLFPFSSTESR